MVQDYNLWVVGLSFLIAVLASYSALNLSGRIFRARGQNRFIWLLAGSCVMGCGVWSMHFVGMMAYHARIEVSYDPWFTLLSAGASILASFIAFYVTSGSEMTPLRLGFGGLSMGAGIVAMHYIGMTAIRLDGAITYNRGLWLLSALIALVASYAALLLFRRFRFSSAYSKWKLLCSLIMGLAICGMHYTGMAAAHFPDGMRHEAGESTPQLFLLVGVTMATFVMLAVSWLATYFDRHVLERMAYTDTLTGLDNRHGLERYFEETFRMHGQGAVFFIDLDRFKTINDTLGHDIGDLLLCELAARLQQSVGQMETVFRLGGDEFLIASTDGEEERMVLLARELLEQIKEPLHIEGNELFVTASIGISLAPQHGTSKGDLMRSADTAMYQAKEAGKNRIRVYDEEMDRRLVRKLVLEKDLRKALKHGELSIVYQPKWESIKGEMVGLEALLRWQHPELGPVSPGEFIPIAEETGIIVPITRWVLREACSQNRVWQDSGIAQVPVSVNLSGKVFESESLRDFVEEALQAASLSPTSLELEITETVAMNDMEEVVSQLRELRALGVRVSLDDFGTGYSSLGSLDEMPFDTLKIDQIFVRGDGKASKQAILRSIIHMAQQLQLEVVAEGVESEGQLRMLQSHGCRIMQGYYYSKPMAADQLEAWLGTCPAQNQAT